DVLSVSPVLMEKYLAAAEKIMNRVFDAEPGKPPTANYDRLMFPAESKGKEIRARKIISHFATRAFRRPLSSDEQKRLMDLFKSFDRDGESFDHAIKLVLEAVLISPQFLFRGDIQPEPDNPKAVHPVDDYAL